MRIITIGDIEARTLHGGAEFGGQGCADGGLGDKGDTIVPEKVERVADYFDLMIERAGGLL